MAVEARQGGNTYFHLGLQPDPDTLISDNRKMRRNKLPFVEFDLTPAGEQRQSESIRGSIFAAKSQAGKLSGTGRIVTELFRNGMLNYIQANLNGDPEVLSTDVDLGLTVKAGEANVLFTGTDNVTPAASPATSTTVSVGTATGDDVTLTTAAADALDGTPSRIKITLADATGEVTIKGKRRYGLGSRDLATTEETIDLDDTDHDATTDTSFAEIDSITFDHAGLTAGTATDLEIEGVIGLRNTKFQARSEVFDGLSIAGVVGEEPRTALTMVPNAWTFNVTDTIRLTMDLLGRIVYRRRTIEGGVFDEVLTPDADLDGDAFIDSDFFVDYGGYLEFDDDEIIFDDFNLSGAQNLQYRPGKDGSRIEAGIERGDAGAEVTGSITVNFESGDDANDVFIRWDERYRDNILSKIVLWTYFWTDTGKEYYHKITLFNVELTGVPATPVSGRGNIKESLEVRAVVDGDDPLMEWEIVDDDGWFGVTPTMSFEAALATAVGDGDVTIDFGRSIPTTGTGGISNTALAALITVSGATKGLITGSGSTRTLALTASVAGTLSVTLAKNAVPQGNAETVESITVT